MSKLKHEPTQTYDCIDCPETGYTETYFTRGDGPFYCECCGKELLPRPNGIEPLEGDESTVTATHLKQMRLSDANS